MALTGKSVRYFRAVISYDGTAFLGFQIQASGRTVQGVLETALTEIAKNPVRIIGAGRTDAGVHALGQVISFPISWAHSSNKLRIALNVKLPNDVVVRSLSETNDNFHPRFDAKSRHYRYVISTGSVRDVFNRQYTLWLNELIDIDLLQRATMCLLGTHDLAAFGKPPQGTNTIRTIFQARWLGDGNKIVFEIVADAFLYRMVRNIVGTLLQVGLGQIEVGHVAKILLSKNRAESGPPVAPQGLFLVKVNY